MTLLIINQNHKGGVEGSNTTDYTQYVSTLIGTGGDGYGIGSLPTGAQVPYGMVRLGPDTTSYDDFFMTYRHFGGYYYKDEYIGMLSHTHTVGAGVLDYGTTGVIPSAEVPNPNKRLPEKYPFKQKFNHTTEIAEPGYYAATFEESKITIELTATTHVGVHRYTYNHEKGLRNQEKVIIFDASYTLLSGACGGSYIYINNTGNGVQEVNGWVHNNGGLSSRFGGMVVYFVAQFNTTFNDYGIWNDTGSVFHGTEANGTSIGGYVTFPAHSPITNDFNYAVEMYVGISFLSIDQARTNLNYEMQENSRSFDIVRSKASSTWQDLLHTVEISDLSSISQANLTVFYSALYHSYLAPTLFSEIGGYYLGFDDQQHQLPCNYTQQPYVYNMTSASTINNCAYYTDMSIWDTYRTQFPWLGLMQPYVMRDVAQSLVYMYEQGGDLPRWPMANGYTSCMIGAHADIVLADALSKNIPFDYDTAYAGMYQSATQQQANAGMSGIEYYLALGYVPRDVDQNGCSETLEYTYDDWAVALFARSLQKQDDYEMFMNLSQNYRTQWNSSVGIGGFMCPRFLNGSFDCPHSLVYPFDNRYTEGNAWQWRWYVPHDVKGLIDLFPSEEIFISQLTEFFENSMKDPYNILPNLYYWAGNEPDLFAPYLFLWTSSPSLTQKYLRQVLDLRYTAEPRGIPGNDDYGTMSNWAVWAFIGIYPLAGNGTYLIGSPCFENVTLHRDDGDIQIIAHNAGPSFVYIEQALLNGVDIPSPFLTFEQLQSGATLEFYMSDTPTSLWANQNNFPPS